MTAGGQESGLVAAMAVRMVEALDGHARSEEAFKDAVGDKFNALRRNAFIVEFVGSGQFHSGHFGLGGIVHDAQEFRNDFLADFFGEGLPFVFVALAVPLEAVAENFVEEDSGGAAAQKRRTGIGLGDRSFAQGVEVGGPFFGFGGGCFFVWQGLVWGGLEEFAR